MENEKYLFVVSGAAGTGKDSVVKALREAHPEIEKTVSATTRAPRPGEQEAWTTTTAPGSSSSTSSTPTRWWSTTSTTATTTAPSAKRWISASRRASWWCWSSTSTARPISAGCSRGYHHLPAAALRGGAGTPPPGRGTETEASILERLDTAKKELAQQEKFTLTLVNDEVDACAEKLYGIIRQRAGLDR